MQNAFTLKFIPVSGISDDAPAWVLEPLTPLSYTEAAPKLIGNWRNGIMAGSDRIELFIFKQNNADVEEVLADLEAVGVARDSIEVTVTSTQATGQEEAK